ncbi:MAG: DUF2975 domain-containing protein [Oscillospiraceae bacterium]
MWSKNKSIILSQVIIKVMDLGIVIACIIAPKLVELYDTRVMLEAGLPSVYAPLLITLYCCVPPALTALISLDLLLFNIQHGDTFVKRNVGLLRIISWCCFLGSAIFVYFSILRPFALTIVVVAAFLGIILRVVKNCFEEAVALREENDFTI